ncbi:MAG: ribbon-helix-helix protein, CopG family [Cutibacterium granulosum]|nr:ribbon-helix-helix protein, CopG family [Cutibacterium granulosum]
MGRCTRDLGQPAVIKDVTRFNAVLTTSLLARIDSAAAAAGLSRSEWIRRRCAEATTDDEH